MRKKKERKSLFQEKKSLIKMAINSLENIEMLKMMLQDKIYMMKMEVNMMEII